MNMASALAVLEAPFDADVDPDELVRAAMRWHFTPETGTPFWLDRLKSLDFDPLTDVRTMADLHLFPQVVDDLRYTPVEDLLPRGYGGAAQVIGVFESGGTTGVPKRVLYLADWMDREMASAMRAMDERGYPRGVNWLSLGPSGPHDYAELTGQHARRRAGVRFAVDFDPRWVRRCLREGRDEDADRYLDHVLAQAADVLRTQRTGALQAPPPLLERLARDERTADLVREQVQVITWCGTSMDRDTRDVLSDEVFPGIPLFGLYGSTMALGAAFERTTTDGGDSVFDSPSAHVTYTVADPGTGRPVAVGETGQVVMHHLSKSALLPNNRERDRARRVSAPPDAAGHSVADVRPLEAFTGVPVITGAY
ncbi:phenazine antibiotic biosynthesis protein [Streptomyces sp. MBT56]|uniref:phenazine antibiotic biosynthesis protein n=1 Tax=unclassified Streptomyces TaxID=2593676 RepID=UPI0019095F4F|nr:MULTISPECIES: phenazine antibiotic biosynthesis protein [unclassified Streptomyces]MBK3555815.1 phenazine antibiotic biosynthesis protein [Streptomyces sp. MBT56]MBK3605799.1 phenazine antibiotic biosynthesis protein [Streptomyces sp. MBT54]MBK3618280.1 phenazine antibiotic biosynthesis protein [Streptomyces sp. MBT98]MBK6044990.1 phenazine antibiotic biosynthesis protein [Streptomyces sp. MBT55]